MRTTCTFPGVDRGVRETCVARPLVRECHVLQCQVTEKARISFYASYLKPSLHWPGIQPRCDPVWTSGGTTAVAAPGRSAINQDKPCWTGYHRRVAPVWFFKLNNRDSTRAKQIPAYSGEIRGIAVALSAWPVSPPLDHWLLCKPT